MRTFIAALALVSTMAQAQNTDWIARIPNKAGGQIVFLNLKGSCQHGRAVYGSTSSGLTTWGCWIPTDNHVMVFWNEGDTRSSAFSYGSLEMNPALENKSRNSPGTTF